GEIGGVDHVSALADPDFVGTPGRLSVEPADLHPLLAIAETDDYFHVPPAPPVTASRRAIVPQRERRLPLPASPGAEVWLRQERSKWARAAATSGRSSSPSTRAGWRSPAASFRSSMPMSRLPERKSG